MIRSRMAGLVVAAALATSGCAWVGRVGVSSTGAQPGGGTIFGTDVSRSGRYVVFNSEADNLVPDDLNGAPDVFWRDNQTGVTERVSVSDSEVEGIYGGYGGMVSADGRYVAFMSDSDNLVTGDTNDSTDVFLRDRQLGTTIRVSVKSAGGQVNDENYLQSMTPDAKVIVFASDATNVVGGDTNDSTDVFVRDLSTATPKTQRISVSTTEEEGDLDSYGGSVSDDGRYIAFVSDAANFDAADSGAWTDVFVRDRSATTTILVTDPPGTTDEADFDSTNVFISGNGQVVGFDSDAGNLISPADTNGTTDVYTTVLGSGVFERTTVATGGGDASDDNFVVGLSDDGRFVLFQSGATNLVDQSLTANSNSFVRDRLNHTTALAATTQKMQEPIGPNAFQSGSVPGAISGDGRYVLFSTDAPDVMNPDSNGTVTDLYLESNPVPIIFFSTPNTVARGSSTTLSLHGSGFRAQGALIVMGDGIVVTSITQVSENQVDVAVTVAADAAVGPRTPTIVQSGGAGVSTGGLAFLPGAFSVT